MGSTVFASLPSLLLARMKPNTRKPPRQETATTAAMTMPAMAPEDRSEGDLEALGLLDGLDTDTGEVVVASALDQQKGTRIWAGGILWSGVADKVVEILLKAAISRLLEDVDEDTMEDSTALASAIDTFAFALAKLVQQMLI